MDLELNGKKALISAGHKGIGLYIGKRLLEEGAVRGTAKFRQQGPQECRVFSVCACTPRSGAHTSE